jgi:hypothetical protein
MEAVGEHIAGYIDYGEGREYIVWGRDQTYPTGVGGIGSDTQLTPDNRFAVEQYDTAQEEFTSYEAGEMERLLVLTSHAPTVSVSGNHLIKPEAERLYFASEAPIFFPEGVASPAVATLSLTGQIPRVSMLLTVPVRPLILAGWWPIAVERTSYTIEVDEATLTLAGEAPGAVDLGANITVPEATLQLTGVVPIADLTHSGEASEATLLLTGKAPLIAQSISFFPPVATLVLEADAPTFYIKRVKHRAGGRKRLISFTITRRLEHLKD